MPPSPQASIAVSPRYGLPEASEALSSMFAFCAPIASAPGTKRSEASRLSGPQKAYALAKYPGRRRIREGTLGAVTATTPWRSRRMPATNDSPSGVMPSGPSPPDSRLRPSLWIETWKCQPLPTPSGVISGANDARSPLARAAVRIVSRASNWSSAALSGSLASSDSSSCDQAYSAWICPMPSPLSSRSASSSERNSLTSSIAFGL